MLLKSYLKKNPPAVKQLDMEGLFSRLTDPLTRLTDSVEDIKDSDVAEVAKKKPKRGWFSFGTKLSKALPYASFHDMLVAMPENSVLPFPKHLETTEHLLEQLIDVEKRVLEPLLDWSYTLLEEPESINKIWIKDNVELVDIKKLEREFKNNTSDFNDSNRNFVTVFEMYTLDARRVEDCGDICYRMDKSFDKLLKRGIVDKADKIYDNISKAAIEIKGKEALKNFKECGDLVEQVARELELLSLVLFSAKKGSHAYTKSIKAINEQVEVKLKEQ